jgi:large subunit ribosomal protein L9
MARIKKKKTRKKIPLSGPRIPKGGHRGLELLLIQDVDHLGKQGEVVSVRPGYAKNYLVPQGLATIATEHHKRMVEKHKAKLQEIQKARMAGLRKLSEDLAQASVTIEANANDEGHLYGSVGANDIVNALKKLEFTITSDQVRLTGPLKELGLYTVKIHLGHEIESDLKVWVVPSTADEERAAEKAEKVEKAATTAEKK